MNRLLNILLLTLFVSCQNGEQKVVNNETQESEWIDPNSIQQVPIIRDSLTSDQIDKIEFLFATFEDVDDTSLKKWIEDFKRDQNPDREIEIWIMMANAYNSFCQGKALDLEVKKEVYKVVLMRSTAPEDEVLTHLELAHLSNKEVIRIMKNYNLEAKPIRIIEK
jgi:hypothetical protein